MASLGPDLAECVPQEQLASRVLAGFKNVFVATCAGFTQAQRGGACMFLGSRRSGWPGHVFDFPAVPAHVVLCCVSPMRLGCLRSCGSEPSWQGIHLSCLRHPSCLRIAMVVGALVAAQCAHDGETWVSSALRFEFGAPPKSYPTLTLKLTRAVRQSPRSSAIE